MICTCAACLYTFQAPVLPERCPDCGKLTLPSGPAVRVATEQEVKDYFRIQAEESSA